MDDWFERIARKIIGRAIQDAANWAVGEANSKLTAFLKDQKPGVPVSQKPLIVVTEDDVPAHAKEFLLTGDVKISNFSAFARVEVRIDTQSVDVSKSPPIKVLAWPTIIGDVRFNKEGGGNTLIDLALRFQHEADVYGVGGTLIVTPFPRLAAYGAFGEGKFVVSVDAQLPPGAPIALGPTGLAIWGIGGTFAHNFQPRLVKPSGAVVTNPTAEDYIRWARDSHIEDQWKPCTPGQSATGLGLNLYFGTVDGLIFMAKPAGFSYLTPGALIIGGEGRILRQEGFKGNFYLVLDIPSGSVALSIAANVEIKVPWALGVTTLSGNGQLDLFFSFHDATAWYFNLGREDAPVRLSVLEDVPVLSLLFSEQAEAYLQINHHRIAFGAKLGIGGEFKLLKGKIKLIARLAAQIAAMIARDPLLVKAAIAVAGELGISIWDFDFLLKGEAKTTIYFPHPAILAFDVSIKLDLPWPIPDIETSKHFGDTIPSPPVLASPMNAGHWTRGSGSQTLDKVNGQHLLSTKQFLLDLGATDKAWPDIDIVVPFSERVTDKTGAVLGPAVPAKTSSDYVITQTIDKIEVFDETQQQLVPGVRAVWEDELNDAGKVERSVLHVLGTDPFSWITSQVSSWSTTTTYPAPSYFQLFGNGPDETFKRPRRFGRVLVKPKTGSDLSNDFIAALASRVLKGHQAALLFVEADGTPTEVDQVDLYFVIGMTRWAAKGPSVSMTGFVGSWDMPGGFKLVQLRRDLSPAVSSFDLASLGADLPLYAVGFRVAPRSFTASGQRTLLVPGKYTLRISGSSSGAYPGSDAAFPAPDPVAWGLEQTFETTYPGTARPYIFHASFGDTKLFSKPQPPWTAWTRDLWNPGHYGTGFPAYRHYDRVIRFLVPYADQIFPAIHARLAWSDGAAVHESRQGVTIRAAADGQSSLVSPQAQAWLTAHGGSADPDIEAVVGNAVPAGRQVAFTLSFDHPAGGSVEVDSWSFYASAFDDFRHHLAWDQPGCLTTRYTRDGRMAVPAVCAPIVTSGGIKWPTQVIGINRLLVKARHRIEPERSLLDDEIKVHLPPGPYPDELSNAPASWHLPAPIADCFGALDGTAAERFVQMASASGARFGRPAPEDPLDQLLAPPAETELVALTDGSDRLIALWLRTPEPVDWRRVSASLKVRHVEPGSGCPTGFAHRHPLMLDVAVLTSPDGASAFLAGRFNGSLIELPRGQYTLSLSFDPAISGLPPLYPTPLVGTTPERLVYEFIQPLGAPWPLPSGKGPFRFDHIDLLRKYVVFDPHIWERGLAEGLDAGQIEERIRASIANPLIDPPVDEGGGE